MAPSTQPSPAPGGLVEPLITLAVATGLACALFWSARSVGFIREILHGAIAVTFLLSPSFASRISHRPFDQQVAGLGMQPLGLNLRILTLGVFVTWPLFLGGFLLFYGLLCPSIASGWMHAWGQVLAPMCGDWPGWAGIRWHLPSGFPMLAASQLIVVAVPEEFFFRGYLMTRFEERWPSRRRLWGAQVGWPLLFSSALFGLGHFLVDFQPARLMVAFPALAFGWMRARTRSLAPGAAFHAMCNLLSEVLHGSVFG